MPDTFKTRLAAAVAELDAKGYATRPNDYMYQRLLSSYARIPLRRGETWRGRCVRVANGGK